MTLTPEPTCSCSPFVAFGITGPIPPTESGITLAMAVLRNWWLPTWLDRILVRVHFSH